MSGHQLRSLLERNGVRFVRQRGTSHAIYERIVDESKYRAPVLVNARELSPKYVKLVLRQLGFGDDDIKALFPD